MALPNEFGIFDPRSLGGCLWNLIHEQSQHGQYVFLLRWEEISPPPSCPFSTCHLSASPPAADDQSLRSQLVQTNSHADSRQELKPVIWILRDGDDWSAHDGLEVVGHDYLD